MISEISDLIAYWLISATDWHLLYSLIRKPSWRKDKRATAVRVWRPLAKESTADQPYAIFYWWLTVTSVVLLTVCEIFSRIELENRHFRTLYCDYGVVQLLFARKKYIKNKEVSGFGPRELPAIIRPMAVHHIKISIYEQWKQKYSTHE